MQPPQTAELTSAVSPHHQHVPVQPPAAGVRHASRHKRPPADQLAQRGASRQARNNALPQPSLGMPAVDAERRLWPLWRRSFSRILSRNPPPEGALHLEGPAQGVMGGASISPSEHEARCLGQTAHSVQRGPGQSPPLAPTVSPRQRLAEFFSGPLTRRLFG